MANYSKNKKYHYTYRTTNLINGRYYLGMHSTNHLDDGYLGSGKRLYYELSKYGRDNFKFEILKYFNSREELVQAEVKLITEEYLNNLNCLNLKPGGSGGFTIEQTKNGGKLSGAKHAKRLKTDKEYRKQFIDNTSRNMKLQFENGTRIRKQWGNWKGRKHSDESIKKMKQSKKRTVKGKNNSQYGTSWITDEIESKKINKGDLIPKGWRLGRKMN